MEWNTLGIFRTGVLASTKPKSPGPVWGAGVFKPAVLPPGVAVTLTKWHFKKPFVRMFSLHLNDPGANVRFTLVEAEVSVKMLQTNVPHFMTSLFLAEIVRKSVHGGLMNVLGGVFSAACLVFPWCAEAEQTRLRSWPLLVVSRIQTGREIGVACQAASREGE